MRYRLMAVCLLGTWLAVTPAHARPTQKSDLLFGLRSASLEQAVELGAGWCAGPTITWGVIAPRRGSLNWSRLDAVVRSAGVAGVELVPTLCCFSSWGSAPALVKSNAANRSLQRSGYPADEKAWRGFVSALVERYDGDGNGDMPGLRQPIKCWQLERELPRGWAGSGADLVRFLRLTYPLVKAADPGATVVAGGLAANILYACAFVDRALPALTVDSRPLDRANLEANKTYREQREVVDALLGPGAGYYDVVDLHLFGNCEAIPQVVEWVNSRPGVRAKPKWCLQGGGPVARFDGSAEDPDLPGYVLKWYVMLAAAGVQRGAWDAAAEAGSAEAYREAALFTAGGPRRAACTAYRTARTKLAGFIEVRASKPLPEVTFVRFTMPSSRISVLWASTPRTIDVTRYRGTKLTNAEGKPVPLPSEKMELGPAPLYAE